MLLFLCYVYIAFKYVYNVIGYFNFCNGSFFILRFAFNSIGVSIAFLSSLQLILIFFFRGKRKSRRHHVIISLAISNSHGYSLPRHFLRAVALIKFPFGSLERSLRRFLITCNSQGVSVYTSRKRIILLFDLWMAFLCYGTTDSCTTDLHQNIVALVRFSLKQTILRNFHRIHSCIEYHVCYFGRIISRSRRKTTILP